MRHLRLMLTAILSMVLMVGCGFDLSPGSGVRAEGEIKLTRDQPVMAIEFEASFDSSLGSGMYAKLAAIRPSTRDELSAVESFHREFWDGEDWVPVKGDGPEVTGIGTNIFRYRWVIELEDDIGEATIPFVAEINPIFGGGSDAPGPDEREFVDLRLSIISSYPLKEG